MRPDDDNLLAFWLAYFFLFRHVPVGSESE